MRHSAPALTLPIRPDRLMGWIVRLLPALALLATLAWVWDQLRDGHAGADHLGGVVAAGLACVGLACLAAWRGLELVRHPGCVTTHHPHQYWQPTHLRWDGSAWCLCRSSDGDDRPCDVNVRIDAGHWLLLRLQAAPSSVERGAPRWTSWLSLAQSSLPTEWHGLRCALFSMRPSPTRLDDR
jgi:hypothetical protein